LDKTSKKRAYLRGFRAVFAKSSICLAVLVTTSQIEEVAQ
jgi:hypothetical protein